MNLITQLQVKVDCVMRRSRGASDEGRGFERSGWAMVVFDDETMAFITQTHQGVDADFFGRRTYEAPA